MLALFIKNYNATIACMFLKNYAIIAQLTCVFTPKKLLLERGDNDDIKRIKKKA